APGFRRLVEDILEIVGPPVTEAKRKTDEENQRRIEEETSRVSTTYPAVEQPKGELEPGTVFRDALKDGSQGPEMVIIPAGTFQMGDGRGFARPVRTVGIISPFAIGRYEVTFEEYDWFVAATGHELPNDDWGRGRQPVINVSWNDAMEYAKW